jgi:predicted ATPase
MGRDFVGRLGELRFLEAAWLAAGAGTAAPVIVVYGESGIGKTRTVAELARVVRARGAEVLWGACYEGGDAYPYGGMDGGGSRVCGASGRQGADGCAGG